MITLQFPRQSAIGIFQKTCSANRFSQQLYWNHTSTWVFSCKFAAYLLNNCFDEHLWGNAFANSYLTCLPYFLNTNSCLFLPFFQQHWITHLDFASNFLIQTEFNFVDSTYCMEGCQLRSHSTLWYKATTRLANTSWSLCLTALKQCAGAPSWNHYRCWKLLSNWLLKCSCKWGKVRSFIICK